MFLLGRVVGIGNLTGGGECSGRRTRQAGCRREVSVQLGHDGEIADEVGIDRVVADPSRLRPRAIKELFRSLRSPSMKLDVSEVVTLGSNHPLVAYRAAELDAFLVEPARLTMVAQHPGRNRLHVKRH